MSSSSSGHSWRMPATLGAQLGCRCLGQQVLGGLSCYLWLIVAVLVWMAVGRMIAFCCSCFLQACAVLECSSSARRVMLVCDNVSLQAAITGVGACSG